MRNLYFSTTCIALILTVTIVSGCKSDINNDDVFIQCEHDTELRGNRTIAFDILDFNEKGDFGENFDIAKGELNAGFIQRLQPWNAFENSQSGVYNGHAMELYEILNGFSESTGASLSLIITPIDIPGRFLPADLSTLKFDNPIVIERFNSLIDAIFNPNNGVINPERVIALSVGNEIDHYAWISNNDQVSDYKEFLEGIRPRINSCGIPLYFTVTLYGTINNSSPWVDLASVVDKVSFTYYTINNDFSVKSPDLVFSDLQVSVSKFPEMELFLQEVGYPSSTHLKSSESMQAQFFCNFFKAWDLHRGQIPYVSILRLNVVSEASARETAHSYGVPGNKSFIKYIRAIGIRTWEGNGIDKMAFDVIKNEIEQRDWLW